MLGFVTCAEMEIRCLICVVNLIRGNVNREFKLQNEFFNDGTENSLHSGQTANKERAFILHDSFAEQIDKHGKRSSNKTELEGTAQKVQHENSTTCTAGVRYNLNKRYAKNRERHK